jgi:hypothetical protein
MCDIDIIGFQRAEREMFGRGTEMGEEGSFGISDGFIPARHNRLFLDRHKGLDVVVLPLFESIFIRGEDSTESFQGSSHGDGGR